MIPSNIRNYCKQPKEIANYIDAALDDSCIYVCHHREETDRENIPSSGSLENDGLYYNRPANEFILMKPKDHKRLHSVASRYYVTPNKYTVRKYSAPLIISKIYEDFIQYGWAPVFVMIFMLHSKYFLEEYTDNLEIIPPDDFERTTIEEIETAVRSLDFTNSIGISEIWKAMNILIENGIIERNGMKFNLNYCMYTKYIRRMQCTNYDFAICLYGDETNRDEAIISILKETKFNKSNKQDIFFAQ